MPIFCFGPEMRMVNLLQHSQISQRRILYKKQKKLKITMMAPYAALPRQKTSAMKNCIRMLELTRIITRAKLVALKKRNVSQFKQTKAMVNWMD
jgi:hypothetical protein